MWQIPKIWLNGECWIIGGGTSVLKQFGIPEHLTLGKGDLSPYSPYFQGIHHDHVIGVNAAFKLGDWVSVCYFGDRGFFRKFKFDLAAFHNLKIRHCALPGQKKVWGKDIKQIRCDINGFGICEEADKIYWNYNSGAAAVNLAYHFGVKRIKLLGFDMKPNNNDTHWHNEYRSFRITDGSFARFLRPWNTIASDAKRLGLEIINVNPDSAIDAFPKVNLKEVL